MVPKMDIQEEHPRIIQFRLGKSIVWATGDAMYEDWPHVLRVSIIRSAWQRILVSFLAWLPWSAQALVRSIWPGYFLPSTVILKKLKPGWDDEFNHEINMYDRLKAIQGHQIPVFYGEAWCEGSRALVLSEVRGVVSCEQKPPYLPRDEFKRRVETALREMIRYGLVYDDNKLHNVLLVDDRIVFVDLEMVFELGADEEEWAVHMTVRNFMTHYDKYLEDVEMEDD